MSMPKARRDFYNCDIAFMAVTASHAWYAAPLSSGLSSQDGVVIIVRGVRSRAVELARGAVGLHMGLYSIGVDLGGTNLRIAAIDTDGKLLEKLTTGTEVGRGRDWVIGEMCDAIQSLKVKFRDSGQLAGIGIGVPGFIDMDTGTVIESPNLPDWANFPVRDEIQRRLGTPVILENDANSAAMGEKWLGAGRDTDHMAMYTLGTGVGGGLVLNGRLWHGMNGMAGELGHFTVEPEGHACGC